MYEKFGGQHRHRELRGIHRLFAVLDFDGEICVDFFRELQHKSLIDIHFDGQVDFFARVEFCDFRAEFGREIRAGRYVEDEVFGRFLAVVFDGNALGDGVFVLHHRQVEVLEVLEVDRKSLAVFHLQNFVLMSEDKGR